MQVEKFQKLCETRALKLIDQTVDGEGKPDQEAISNLIDRMAEKGDDYLYYRSLAESAINNVILTPDLFRRAKSPIRKRPDFKKVMHET